MRGGLHRAPQLRSLGSQASCPTLCSAWLRLDLVLPLTDGLWATLRNEEQPCLVPHPQPIPGEASQRETRPVERTQGYKLLICSASAGCFVLESLPST